MLIIFVVFRFTMFFNTLSAVATDSPFARCIWLSGLSCGWKMPPMGRVRCHMLNFTEGKFPPSHCVPAIKVPRLSLPSREAAPLRAFDGRALPWSLGHATLAPGGNFLPSRYLGESANIRIVAISQKPPAEALLGILSSFQRRAPVTP